MSLKFRIISKIKIHVDFQVFIQILMDFYKCKSKFVNKV
jgi:hypothetical protein